MRIGYGGTAGALSRAVGVTQVRWRDPSPPVRLGCVNIFSREIVRFVVLF